MLRKWMNGEVTTASDATWMLEHAAKKLNTERVNSALRDKLRPLQGSHGTE
jgi:hypothetical protein